MRAFLILIFLGVSFSFALMATEESKKLPQEQGNLPLKKEESKSLCDPQQETKMPETFY